MDNVLLWSLIDDRELLKSLQISQEIKVPHAIHETKKFYIQQTAFWYEDELTAYEKFPFLRKTAYSDIKKDSLYSYIEKFDQKSIVYIYEFASVTIDLAEFMMIGSSNITVFAQSGVQATIKFNTVKAAAMIFNIEIVTQENCHILVQFCDEQRAQGSVYGALTCSIGENSMIQVEHYQTTGQSLLFFDYKLVGKNSRIEHQTLNYLYAGMSQGLITHQRHYAEHTSSNIVIKTIHNDDARTFYRGTISIDKQGAHSIAHQHHRALMLNKKAYTCAIPSLQVENHNVQCSHGTAAARFDEQQLWYLQSRGLELSQAQEILIQSFLSHKPIFNHDKQLLENLLGTSKVTENNLDEKHV